MDYYDPELLAYGDTFPLEEAFRLEWGVDAGAGPQRFALYVIPPKVFPKDGTPGHAPAALPDGLHSLRVCSRCRGHLLRRRCRPGLWQRFSCPGALWE